ncbi:MAG TPA: phage tail tip lysozyme [Candidatus Saccharimonadales bacterium]|nr:phage tail tip lysozyme [Candidatus Saccharimonadales bacterium]
MNEYPNWVADACDGSAGLTTGTVDTSSGETTEPAQAVQQVVWSTLINGGIDPLHAAAVMGNIAHEGVWDPESVENIPGLPPRSEDPTAAGRYGYGLIGWTPGSSLLDQMKEAGISGKPYTAETQAAVILAEIQGKTPNYYPASLGQQFLNTKTIEDATTAYQGNQNVGGPYLGFERPADESGSLPDRIASAKQFLSEFGSGTVTPAPPTTTGGSVSCGCTSDTSGTDVSTTDSGLVGGTPAEKAFNYFLAKGISPAGAAGLVGNFMSESGGNTEQLQPGITNSIGAHGIAQWLGDRLTSLQQFASSHNEQEDDLATQLDFAWHELNSGYKSVLNQIKNASDPAAAADTVNTDYEVSGVDPSTRETNAKKLLSEYGGGADSSVATASNNGSCSSGTSPTPTDNCSVTAPVWGSVHGVGEEYTQQQLTQIFGDPGTASSHPQMDANLTTVDFLGNSVQVNKLVAPCLKAVADQLQSEHVDYKITEMGCYRFDSDNGSSNIGLLSYHTYGAACDINWDTNPWSGDGAELPHDMPQAYIQAFHDHGFTWGGDWVSVKDFMHFEFNGIKPPS